ncbi:hypothetical protein K3495_g847 [Podosphaera aphanis]|nr:hypothetical protein K3495_g847 [Podosphaera aphanis]
MCDYKVGDRVSFSTTSSPARESCTIRYIGNVDGFSGLWLGVEWDDVSRGKHDGSLQGKRYFKCLSSSSTAGSFVRPNRPADPKRSFLEAVRDKYAPGLKRPSQATSSEKPEVIIISGKVAEELGFDKIREIQAQLDQLRIIIVDGMQISVAQRKDEKISDVCPKVEELDLSRNLFQEFKDVAQICSKLTSLRKLKLSGNRFSDDALFTSVTESDKQSFIFSTVTELELNSLLLPWKSIVKLASYFPCLSTLSASMNYFGVLDCAFTGVNLRSLSLDFNGFEYLSDLRPLSKMMSLENLYLKGNQIFNLYRDANLDSVLQFTPFLHYIDLSSNFINSWSFIDELPLVFPGLTGLRVSNNPLYAHTPTESAVSKDDEGFLITIGRLGNLKSLNFSRVTDAERTNAEIYYLSKIAKEVSTVPSGEIDIILSQHRRYRELCDKWGAPPLAYKKAVDEDPAFLESRLIDFTFRRLDSRGLDIMKILRKEIPKSIDIYRVKGIVARYFGIPYLNLRLIWETGEWDPVARYDEQELESDDEDYVCEKLDNDSCTTSKGPACDTSGQWMKREIEIQDSTRQLGSLFDNSKVTVRVEFVS